MAKDPTMQALEAVHAALKPLDAGDRQRVLASVYALLEITDRSSPTKPPVPPGGGQSEIHTKSATPTAARPVAIRELIQEKKPRNHPQFITLFAYYREKHQNLPTFSRAALADYYPMSRETPPGNFDRDFVEAVRRGWIHEDGDNSYITSKGLEVVESNFSDVGERPVKKVKTAKRKNPAKKKSARQTSR
jgi:hypothetical protein